MPGVAARELEQPPQERRLVDAGEEQYVARDRRLDQRVDDVAPPAVRILHQRRRARVPAVEDELLQGPAEGLAHLREGPVGKAQHLEAARQALREPASDEERRRSEEDHLQSPILPCVFVPEPLHRLRPAGDLLDLVQRQDGPLSPPCRNREASCLPLLFDPVPPPERRFVGAGQPGGHPGCLDDRPDERGLAHLPGAGNDLQESPGLLQPCREDGGMRADENVPFTHGPE